MTLRGVTHPLVEVNHQGIPTDQEVQEVQEVPVDREDQMEMDHQEGLVARDHREVVGLTAQAEIHSEEYPAN